MVCDKAGGLMMKYMDGILTDAEAVSLNRHITSCGRCKEDFLAYDSIMQGFSELTLTEAPEELEQNVMDIIIRLPDVRPKSVSHQLSGILGVFSVLISLGFIIIMNKEAIMDWMYQYPQFKPLLNIFVPVSTAVNSISLQVSGAVSQVSSFLRQAGSNLYYVPLMAFGVLAAVQFVIYKKERAVSGK